MPRSLYNKKLKAVSKYRAFNFSSFYLRHFVVYRRKRRSSRLKVIVHSEAASRWLSIKLKMEVSLLSLTLR